MVTDEDTDTQAQEGQRDALQGIVQVRAKLRKGLKLLLY